MGLVIPGSFCANEGCMKLRETFFNQSRIQFIYSFENRNPTVFRSVMGLYNFCVLGIKKDGKTKKFKCAFMQHDPERLPVIDKNPLALEINQILKFSPDSLSIMEFDSQREIDISNKIYGDWPLLGEKLKNSWNAKIKRELDMTNHSQFFKEYDTGFPLFEGKSIWQYDHLYQTPRFWVIPDEIREVMGNSYWETSQYRVGYRDIARGTD